MKRNPKAVYLKDYEKPHYLIPKIDVTFNLHDTQTKITTRFEIKKNYSGTNPKPLCLNGENLKLLSVKVNGKSLKKSEYTYRNSLLTISSLSGHATIEIENETDPINNTTLEGLYKSGNIFCTQCESQGFRRITFFPDRPDVMSKYRTKIIADKTMYPVLLSNGNLIEQGVEENNKHWVCWEDPFVKPAYLFALVAGDLGMIEDVFETQSKKKIQLKIYCDKGNESKCHHAMTSLKKSMKWDEEVFGLEYDLDIFMIVAVDAFNFGAMENKGLNIFNTNAILADEKSATDADFIRVEKVVAHEYFHNWTGNRVTLRDWFQLTLKEGLTVFRDQEFTMDMNARSQERINDVLLLRATQYPEDKGPMCHPIKPSFYIAIDNFYTSTVYKKGAEVIRMVHTLLGPEVFRKGIDRYFALYDGQAVTTEDFIHAMEVASNRDLSQFKRWYHQAGIPRVEVKKRFNKKKKQLLVKVSQFPPKITGSTKTKPLYFPLVIGCVDEKGQPLSLKLQGSDEGEYEQTLEIKKKKQSFTFSGLDAEPVLSINRRCSAPIEFKENLDKKDHLHLMTYDSDDYNRWNSSQELAIVIMQKLIFAFGKSCDLFLPQDYLDAYEKVLRNQKLHPSLKALAMALPSETNLIEKADEIDFDAIHHVREFSAYSLAVSFEGLFLQIYESLKEKGHFSIDPDAMGRRKLKNICLHYLTLTHKKCYIEMCYNQFEKATNMTDEYSALLYLSRLDCEEKDKALEVFYKKWNQDKLVITKWFSVQALSPLRETFENVGRLINDPVFDEKIPNLVRALVGSYIANYKKFHNPNGEGYKFLADWIIKLHQANPHVASRLALGFQHYSRLDKWRKPIMKKELKRVLTQQGLSNHVYEVVSRCLKSK